MEAEDLILDDGSQREIIEQFSENFPNVGISVLSEALIIETIPIQRNSILNLSDLHLSDLTGLVVASQNRDSMSVAYLKGNQQRHSLHRVVASVHVVSHKQVISVGGLPSNFEKLLQVVELAVDITADSDWRIHHRHI